MKLAQFISRLWQKKDINLLPRNSFEESFWGQVLVWAVNVGKWIVVGVEMIVIGVFLVRLGMDRKRVALRKKVDQQIVQIKAYSEFEREFRLLQKRISFAKKVIPEEEKKQAMLMFLGEVMPRDVWVERVYVTANGLNLNAYAGSLYGFGRFIANIKNSNKFSEVTVQSVEGAEGENAKLKFSLGLRWRE